MHAGKPVCGAPSTRPLSCVGGAAGGRQGRAARGEVSLEGAQQRRSLRPARPAARRRPWLQGRALALQLATTAAERPQGGSACTPTPTGVSCTSPSYPLAACKCAGASVPPPLRLATARQRRPLLVKRQRILPWEPFSQATPSKALGTANHVHSQASAPHPHTRNAHAHNRPTRVTPRPVERAEVESFGRGGRRPRLLRWRWWLGKLAGRAGAGGGRRVPSAPMPGGLSSRPGPVSSAAGAAAQRQGARTRGAVQGRWRRAQRSSGQVSTAQHSAAQRAQRPSSGQARRANAGRRRRQAALFRRTRRQPGQVVQRVAASSGRRHQREVRRSTGGTGVQAGAVASRAAHPLHTQRPLTLNGR